MAIDEFKKVNKIMGVEFADRLKRVVDEYNNRRRDEAHANEVLDDVAEQLGLPVDFQAADEYNKC